MTRSLLSLALHAYALATVAYLIHLVRQMPPLAAVGRIAVGLGLALQGAALIIQVGQQGGMPRGISQGLSLFAFLLLAIFLAIDLLYRRPVIGAFVTPIALAVLLPSFLVRAAASPIPEALRRPLLPVHVAIAILGVATFAVAAGVGLMYLLMERQVKLKHFGLLFARLPPLQVLDELNRGLVLLGFIALSITLATGAIFDTEAGSWQWEPKRLATVVGWSVFAVLLSARFFGGWHGKRVAVVTMAGFALLLISFLSSYEPSALAGLH